MPQYGLGSALPLFLAQRDVRGDTAGGLPFITGVAGTGTGKHFVDQHNQPIMMRAYSIWMVPSNGGRWGGTWQEDYDAAITAMAANGVNTWMCKVFGHTTFGGVNDDGRTHDAVLPFVGGDITNFNETFWTRIDYLMAAARAAGITVLLNVAHYTSDFAGGCLATATSTQLGDYGEVLGNRYKSYPNLVWMFGGDYFDGLTTELTALANGIASTGDAHMVGVQNFAESTSRKTVDTNVTQNTGTNLADFNFVYSYNVTYDAVEFAWDEASPLPAIWCDGHYDQDTGAAERKLMRDLVWWALSSGSRGCMFGSEALWQWPTGALAALTSDVFPNTDLPVIWDTFEALPGWHLLAPDTNNSFLTAGRGTHAAALTSGGGGGEYNTVDPQDGYVTAAVTPDGRLAVVYFPVDTTVTVDPAELVASYEVFWVDPASGATTAESITSTYSPTGTNSLGGADRVLVFRAL